MPTYEYECSNCGKIFDHFQSMSSPLLTDCPDPECGGKGTLKRLVGAGAGLIFKGSGFYITDYKKSSGGSDGKPASKSSQDSKSSNGKSAEAKSSESKSSESKSSENSSSGGSGSSSDSSGSSNSSSSTSSAPAPSKDSKDK